VSEHDGGDDDEVLQQALARLALLADLSEALAATLDAGEGINRVCRLLAQRLGDWCAVDLLRGPDLIERASTSRPDGEGQGRPADSGALPSAAAPHRAATSHRVPQDGVGPFSDTLRGAGPRLLTASDLRELPREGEWDAALAEELTRQEASSVILAPVRLRQEVLGVLTVARLGERPGFSELDLTLVRDLAHRVGLALDNARLHAETESIAERLQRSLLPDLPQLNGLAIAARYLASGAAAQVGGDWYDIFQLPDGQSALIVGDVVGHDLKAAVTMSQLRNMLRGIACDRQEPPEAIIRRLDTAARTLYPGMYATCIYTVLRRDPDTGARYLDYTSAGHPPPLLITADGETRYLEAGHGPLLGIDDAALPRTSATTALPSGATVLLYTDGLIERRGESLDHGLTRLRRHAAGLAAETPDALCDELLSALDPADTDDVALLAVRLTAED
jgi:serine phosphatase RsbU (regulator of sigma subunit)